MVQENENHRFRIGLVNTYHHFGGGDSTYTFNLAGLLRNKGHEVHHFAMQGDRNLPDPDSDLFVSHIDFKEINRFKSIGNGLRTLTRSIYSTEAKRNFVRFLDRVHPELIHLQNIHAHITPSVIFEARKRSIPVVWTLHDYKLVCPNSHYRIDTTAQICGACGDGRYYHAFLKKCKKGSFLASTMASGEAYVHRMMRVPDKVDFFLAPSAFLRGKLLENSGVPAEKLIHIPLFIEEKMFSKTARDEGYLLFMAKLEAIKGIHVLLDACRLASSVKLILAGRAEESLLRELNAILPRNATYVGIKQGEELDRLRSAARAVVLPSIWYENQPFAILEAFASGKPVIASDLGGMTELVRNGERGLLVPPGDADALANALQWMADNPQKAGQMGSRAQKYAAREHVARTHYQRLMQIYTRALGRPNQTGAVILSK